MAGRRVEFLGCLVLSFLCACNIVAGDGESKQLYFMYMTSRGALFNSSGTVAGVDMALERINSNGNVLSGYYLNYTTLFDSQCDRVLALDTFLNEVQEEGRTQYVAVLGAGCSIATEPVADIVQNFNMPMISYASAAKFLKDKNRFKSHFRTLPSEEFLSPGIAGFIRYFGWKQIAFITQKEALFQETEIQVSRLLSPYKIVIEPRQFNSRIDDLKSVTDLFVEERYVRVFMLNMFSTFARIVLCEAYKKGLYYPKYVWLTYGWYRKDWWEAKHSPIKIDCTDEQLVKVLNNSLSILQYPRNNLTQPTLSNLTGNEFLYEYGRRARMYNLEFTLGAALAYDAVWAIALALDKSIKMVASNSNSGCEEYGNLTETDVYENFTYSNRKLWCLLDQNIANSDFVGVSGDIQFEDGERADDSLRIDQYRSVGESDLQRVHVANFFNTSNLVYIEGQNNQTVWPDGIPHDGVPEEIITTVALPLTVIFIVLTVAGIVFALVCFIFNVAFRERKVVRLTSPNLNYLIILGAILLYLSVLFLVIPTLDQDINTIYCNINVWLFSVGNTLCFAVVLAKMWRVYYIYNFSKPSQKPKPPKDWHLVIMVSIIVAVDIVTILVPTAIPTARLTAMLRDNNERPDFTNGDPVEYQFYYCTSDSHLIWLGISYAYKLVLQAVAMYFAFRTRKVKIRALNDSKSIAGAIYITSLILVALVGIDLASGGNLPNVNIVFVGIGRLVYPSVILGFVFIPKMVNLYRDPKGENIFTKAGTTLSLHVSDPVEKIATLEKKITGLELKLKEYESNDSKIQLETDLNGTQSTNHDTTTSSKDSREKLNSTVL